MPLQLDDCVIPCKVQVVTLSFKNAEQEEEGKETSEASLYFPARVVQKRERFFYSFVSLLA